MKHSFLFLLLITSFTSCKITEKPEFLTVKNIKVLHSNSDSITLSANAFFNNPNDVGGELRTDGIKVYVNDNEVATVSSESFKVPAKKEFTIPLTANILTKNLLNENNLGSLLGSLLGQNLKVQYVGEIKYKVFGLNHTYKIDKTEDVKIKL